MRKVPFNELNLFYKDNILAVPAEKLQTALIKWVNRDNIKERMNLCISK